MITHLKKIKNYIYSNFISSKNKKWIFIYGHHRGGTTYALEQYLKISRAGVGDWMLHQYIEAIEASRARKHQRINTNRIERVLLKSFFRGANVGTGENYDLVIKQAITMDEENRIQQQIDYFTQVFQNPPTKILFLYREPNNWYNSVEKKFGYDESKALFYYKKVFNLFNEVGGVPIDYDEINDFFNNNNEDFQNVQLDNFKPKKIELNPKVKDLKNVYEQFKKEH